MNSKSDNRTTPYGLWRYGNDFRKAALAALAHHNDSVFVPYYFLIGQSIELFLKAFLSGRGVPIGELRSRKFGHDLKALLREARRRRLGLVVKLDIAHCGAVDLLSHEYRKRRYQYIETGMMSVPDVRFVQEAADSLSEGLEAYCRKKTKL